MNWISLQFKADFRLPIHSFSRPALFRASWWPSCWSQSMNLNFSVSGFSWCHVWMGGFPHTDDVEAKQLVHINLVVLVLVLEHPAAPRKWRKYTVLGLRTAWNLGKQMYDQISESYCLTGCPSSLQFFTGRCSNTTGAGGKDHKPEFCSSNLCKSPTILQFLVSTKKLDPETHAQQL